MKGHDEEEGKGEEGGCDGEGDQGDFEYLAKVEFEQDVGEASVETVSISVS